MWHRHGYSFGSESLLSGFGWMLDVAQTQDPSSLDFGDYYTLPTSETLVGCTCMETQNSLGIGLWGYTLYILLSYSRLCRVKDLIRCFYTLHFHHIYREYNSLAYEISKWAIDLGEGMMVWEEKLEGCIVDSGALSLF